jgi:excisionase family DNA binding protein
LHDTFATSNDPREKQLTENTINTGVAVIGDVFWGAHLCQFYQTKEDLIDILVPYFKIGLKNNDSCIWLTSQPLGVEEARATLNKAVGNLDDYVKKGQIEIHDYSEWYTKAGIFDTDEVLQRCVKEENLALERGFNGLRLAGNMNWLEHKDWKSLIDYELAVDSVLNNHRIIAICSYSLDQCGAAEIVDLVTSHKSILVLRSDKWELVNNHKRKLAFHLKKSGLSYADIGRKLGLTRERIRQIMNEQGKPKRKRPSNVADVRLTTGEAAEILNVHVNTVRRWSNNGTLPTYCIGSRGDRRFRKQDLDDFFQRKAMIGVK